MKINKELLENVTVGETKMSAEEFLKSFREQGYMIIEEEISPLERLTLLQEELGYKKGKVSPVALLGLIGEAGEVLAETAFVNFKQLDSSALTTLVKSTVENCKKLDDYKKEIRKMPDMQTQNQIFHHETDFKAELADVFYYVNILATNIGLTINDLATMAHDKVRAKQAAGGSSEDKQLNK